MLLKKKLQKLIKEDFKLVYCKTYFFFFFDACFVSSIYYSVKERRLTGRHIEFAENFRKPTESDISFLVLLGCPSRRYDLGTTRPACEQAPVGDSRVQSRANGMTRERSGEEGVCGGACRHSIDAAVP